MHVLITCKFKKDQMDRNQEKLEALIFRRSMTANSVVSSWISPKFKLIQALMYVLITCQNEKDPIKNSREKVMTSFPSTPHYKYMGFVSNDQGQLTP